MQGGIMIEPKIITYGINELKLGKEPKKLKNMPKGNISDKDYGIELINKIKNKHLKKLYKRFGMVETTFLIGKYFSEIEKDDGFFYFNSIACRTQKEQKEQLLEDFYLFTQAKNLANCFTKSYVKTLLEFSKFYL
jgi:hypothetical protein